MPSVEVGTYPVKKLAELPLEGIFFITKARLEERPGYESHPGEEDRGAYARASVTVPNGIETTAMTILVSHEFNMHFGLKPGEEIVVIVAKQPS